MRILISGVILLSLISSPKAVEIGTHINYHESQGYKDGTSNKFKTDSGQLIGPYVHFKFNITGIGEIKLGPFVDFGTFHARNVAHNEKVKEKKIIHAGAQLEIEIIKFNQANLFTRLGLGHATHTYGGSFNDENDSSISYKAKSVGITAYGVAGINHKIFLNLIGFIDVGVTSSNLTLRKTNIIIDGSSANDMKSVRVTPIGFTVGFGIVLNL